MNALASKAVTEADCCSVGKSGEVLAVDIAAAKALQAAITVHETATVSLLEASGRISATDMHSPIDLPSFDNSAMDGYAVRRDDLAGEGPWTLRLAGRNAAGARDRGQLSPGETFRIMTGAPTPAGCDAVIMQENCTRSDDNVTFAHRPDAGANIRRAGEDVSKGERILETGTILTPPRIALMAAAGLADATVLRPVRVGLISTGNELTEPGVQRAEGMIYNSNRYFLRAALDRCWIEIRDFGIVRDNAEAIRDVVRQAAAGCDVLITTGGVSAGDEDHMLDVLRRENAELEILKVAMRPGKPVTVGKIGRTLYFGLPGNPYATAITFTQIAWPAIRATAGLRETSDDWMPAVSGFRYARKTGRTEYVPVTWTGRDELGWPIVTMLGRGSSGSLNPMATARAIAILPPDLAMVDTGTPLRIEAFRD
jgi:molybdopterin molybdotransferase